MEFKVGDKVKIEGIIEANASPVYPLKIQLNNSTGLTLTFNGELYSNSGCVLELVERPKVKVKKYRILYEFNERLFVTQDYYKDLNDFKNIIKADMALQLLEATEKEFEE